MESKEQLQDLGMDENDMVPEKKREVTTSAAEHQELWDFLFPGQPPLDPDYAQYQTETFEQFKHGLAESIKYAHDVVAPRIYKEVLCKAGAMDPEKLCALLGQKEAWEKPMEFLTSRTSPPTRVHFTPLCDPCPSRVCAQAVRARIRTCRKSAVCRRPSSIARP